METIGFIIAIIGGVASIYAVLDYRKNHVDKPREEKKHLQIQFNATRNLSISVCKGLREYAERNESYDEMIFPGISISVCVAGLEDSQNTNLSEQLITDSLALPLTSNNIQSMTKSLEDQFNALLQIQAWLKVKQFS